MVEQESSQNIYLPLQPSQVSILTHCKKCRVKFSKVSEIMIHSIAKPECKESLVQFHSLENNTEEVCDKLNLNSNTNLKCSTCDLVFFNAIKYCLHRDSHKHAGKLYVCLTCTKIMFTVTEFLKHKCIREFLSEETKIRSDNNDAMMITDAAAGAGGEDELKEKEEENLSYYEMGNLLTCPSCDQFFDYFAGLLQHWMDMDSEDDENNPNKCSILAR